MFKKFFGSIALALCLIFVPTPEQNAAAGTKEIVQEFLNRDNATFPQYAKDILYYTNKAREENGLQPLRLSKDLNDLAMIRAKEVNNVFSHDRPSGKPFYTVFTTRYRRVGENLAGGIKDAKATVDAWMNSPGHRANILNPDFRELGVGYFVGDGRFKVYWVQLFRRL